MFSSPQTLIFFSVTAVLCQTAAMLSWLDYGERGIGKRKAYASHVVFACLYCLSLVLICVLCFGLPTFVSIIIKMGMGMLATLSLLGVILWCFVAAHLNNIKYYSDRWCGKRPNVYTTYAILLSLVILLGSAFCLVCLGFPEVSVAWAAIITLGILSLLVLVCIVTWNKNIIASETESNDSFRCAIIHLLIMISAAAITALSFCARSPNS